MFGLLALNVVANVGQFSWPGSRGHVLNSFWSKSRAFVRPISLIFFWLFPHRLLLCTYDGLSCMEYSFLCGVDGST